MWRVTSNDHGACMARGIHGQCICIDPLTLPGFHAVANALMAQ
jgi:hypothetical protein